MAKLNDEYIELYKKGVNHRTNTENVLDLDDSNISNVILN